MGWNLGQLWGVCAGGQAWAGVLAVPLFSVAYVDAWAV